MRYIRTTNNQIEFIEVNDEGKILNSIGLQLGEVYFQIKNGKVSFYLNDTEKPFDNFIWSMNIPITIDGEEYEDEDEVSAVLHNIMNDRFQEQLDELREGLAAESARAQEAEEQLDDKIEEETARAISAETHIQTEVTELSGTVATFDERITRCEETVSALSEDLHDEITRSTAKDAEHDAAISGLTTSLNNEITRAMSAETILHNEILAENTRATAAESALDNKIDNETDRAISAEKALNTKVDAEILRSTNKDTQHDNLISALTENLNDEIERAQNAESALTNALNSEIQRAISAETELHNEILGEKNRALAAESALTSSLNSEVTRSTAKDAEHDAAISDLTRDLATEVQNRITGDNTLQTNLTNEVNRATSAETTLHNEIINERDRALAAESALTDALNAEITRSTSKDASHDSEISGLTTSLQNEINRAVGAENSLRNDLNSEISARTSADAAQLQRITALEVGKADANNVYTKAESDAKYATKEYISGMTDNFYTKGQTNELLAAKADKVSAVASAAYNSTNKTIDFKNISGTVISSVDARDFIKDGMVDNVEIVNNNLVITFNADASKEAITVPLTSIFDPTNYYTKSEVDSALSAKADTSLVETISGNVVTLSGEVQTISGNSYTKQEVDGKLANKADLSAFTAHTADTTIHVTASEKSNWNGKQDQLTAGSGITIVNNVISATGGSAPIDAYTKAESDAKFATITNFNSHSGNTTMHVTSTEKATWNNKSDFSGNYNDLTNKPTIPNYTAGDNIDITNNVISTVTKFWCGTQSQYDAISVKDPNTVYMIHD